ncbi:MAG: ABC transporter ATP-binding protein [Clostridium sp.]|uniref:ABC transporter ATP-binding protein n=1 Tax=Clostridium sp. TaxID=1506 RepID=UPI003D6D886C
MKQLLNYLKKYYKMVLLGIVCMIVEVIMDLSLPLLMEQIIDAGISHNDTNLILRLTVIMITVAIVGLITGGAGHIYAVMTSQSVASDIRLDVFRKIQSFSFGNLDKTESGKLITVLTSDVANIQRFFLIMLILMVRTPILLVGIISIILRKSMMSGLILVGIVIILHIIMYVLVNKSKLLFDKVQESIDKINAVILENLKGIRVVKSFVRGDYEIKRFNQKSANLRNNMVRASKVSEIIIPIMMLALNISIVIILWIGGKEVQSGFLSVGEISAIIYYVLRLLGVFKMLGRMLLQIARSSASIKRVNDILKVKPHIDETRDGEKTFKMKGALEFKNVDFSYGGDNKDKALKNISFKINEGETLAILGSTASGKSTLVNLIPRFYDATGGEVLIDGYNVKDIKAQVLRENIAISMQESIIFSGAIKDNIAYATSSYTASEILKISEYAGAREFIDSMKDGLDTHISQRGVNLSGGQKQRISIARALMVNPKILILDDSTSAIDLRTERLIKKSLQENFDDTTIIIVAQRISSAINADRIIVLDEGQIVANGNHKQLIEHSQVYQAIYKSQLREEVM